MNKKKLLVLLTSLTLVAAVGIGATLAYFTDSDEATNVITMGHVDVDLDEPEYDKEAGEDKTINDVTPGQKIVKDPTITVAEDSEDAYVRAKVAFKGLTDTQAAELLANINIDDTVWFLAEDGYYYYNKKLTAGKSVQLFNEVVVPEKWGNEVADLTFDIIVSAEAIQADNFTPTYDDEKQTYIVAWKDSNNNEITAETYVASSQVAPAEDAE